jgi:hypothetical protein
VIAPAAEVALPLIELGHLPLERRAERAHQLADALANTAMDLEKAPLLRTEL